MIKLIKKLFKPKCHQWQTTHTNRYQHSTREVCTMCSLTRCIESGDLLMVKWVYSDGSTSKEFSHFSSETRVKL